jgi:RNA polymerase sigma-70 factor (ECF subfamily)
MLRKARAHDHKQRTMPAEHTDTQSPTSLQALVRSHQGLVARALARAGVAARDVPDLVQEVFIVAHRRLPEWQGRSKLSTWLYRVALNVASDHRRRAYQRRETLPGLDVSLLAADTPVQLELERRDQVLQLCAALEQLSDEHKQALVGYDVEELSVAELAERAQVPHKTIYSRLYAARRLMRQLLLAQGWALLLKLMCKPRRALAAWLVHAPLVCSLLLLTPSLPPQPKAAAPAATRRSELAVAAPQVPSVTPGAAEPLLPPAAPERKSARVAKRRAFAPKQPVAELKVIHTGSVERPEGELPFGFERVEERQAPRIALRGPCDPVDAVVNGLTW